MAAAGGSPKHSDKFMMHNKCILVPCCVQPPFPAEFPSKCRFTCTSSTNNNLLSSTTRFESDTDTGALEGREIPLATSLLYYRSFMVSMLPS